MKIERAKDNRIEASCSPKTTDDATLSPSLKSSVYIQMSMM